VILRPLQNVSQQFVLEKSHGQFHQFDQIVGYERDVDPRRDMHKNPVPHDVEYCHAEQNGDIADQNHVDEIDIRGFDPHVDHRFGDERQDAGKQRDDQHDGENEHEILFIRHEVFQNAQETVSFDLLLGVRVFEFCGRFYGQQFAAFLTFGVPPFAEFLVRILDSPFGRVGDSYVFSVGIVHDYEMVVVPKYDGRERYLIDQIVDRTFDGQRPQTDILCPCAQIEHRDSFSTNAALITQVLERVVFPEMFGDDFQ